MTPIRQLLLSIFNQDFTACKNAAEFREQFFTKTLTLADLKQVCALILGESIHIGGKTIPAALLIKGKKTAPPFAILAQLHGNESAGLAGILLAMALAEAGLLQADVAGVIANPLAAKQYFDAWEQAPRARAEKRDAYRCGLSDDGTLLPDMNRIPVDFLERTALSPHLKRAQELYALGQHLCGIVDIHTARGEMVCITDHKRDGDLQHSPIRRLLTNLAEAISAHTSSATATVQTLKTLLHPLPNIECQVGIEAGRHESKEAPKTAASFTLSLLYNLGITTVKPFLEKDDGRFERYTVKPRLAYADLLHANTLVPEDKVYMARPCTDPQALPKNCTSVAVRKDGKLLLQTALEFIVNPGGDLCYAVSQYEEMEAIERNQVVAIALPSGTEFTAPFSFSGIFFSKSAALYDKDPNVGPWPVAANKLNDIKFCYPCDVMNIKLEFD